MAQTFGTFVKDGQTRTAYTMVDVVQYEFEGFVKQGEGTDTAEAAKPTAASKPAARASSRRSAAKSQAKTKTAAKSTAPANKAAAPDPEPTAETPAAAAE